MWFFEACLASRQLAALINKRIKKEVHNIAFM
jgi:hypothetical protein